MYDHAAPLAVKLVETTMVPPTEEPSNTVTETVASSLGAVSRCPSRVGVGSFVGEWIELSEIFGDVVLIVNVAGELRPVLPAWSFCSACAVYVPSESVLIGPALHTPSLAGTVIVRSGVPEGSPPP